MTGTLTTSGQVWFHDECVPNLIDIDLVQQHPDNPNNGDVELLAELILRNGFYGHVIVQKSTGYILAGNHRYAALKSLDSEKIPAFVVDVDDMQALEFLVADNRSAEVAFRDRREVLSILETLAENGRDLLASGYDEQSIEDLKRLINIDDHAGFSSGGNTISDELAEENHHIVIYGMIGDERFASSATVDDKVEELRALGYNAIGRNDFD